MRALLRLVVMKGTGRKADAPGYRVGGKTGTAQKLINGRYSQTINITSFAGVFPMDDPRYVIVVMLDEPKATPETYGFTTAGWNVAPVVSRTISRIAPMLGVQPDMNREPDMSPGPALRSRNEGVRSPVRLRDLADVDSDSTVTGFAIDHRKVARGSVFGAFRGAMFDGEDFIGDAVAAARSRSSPGPRRGSSRCRTSPTAEPRRLFAELAAKFYAPYPGHRGRRDRHQRQDLDRRDDAPDLAHVGPSLGLDRNARRDHLRRPGEDRPDDARHRHLPVEHGRARAHGHDPCRL